MEELEEQIRVVAEARKKSLEVNEVKRLAMDKYLKLNCALYDSADIATQATLVAEATLRELALKAYAETGNKTPAVGVGIREVTKLAYDNGVALDWAKSHSMALSLDKRAFEKIAKADTPDFVSITTEPQATIATNLEV